MALFLKKRVVRVETKCKYFQYLKLLKIHHLSRTVISVLTTLHYTNYISLNVGHNNVYFHLCILTEVD